MNLAPVKGGYPVNVPYSSVRFHQAKQGPLLMSPQFGLCPVCWTVGGMALLGGIPLFGGLLKKLFAKRPKTQMPCQTTGDTFCQCSPNDKNATKAGS